MSRIHIGQVWKDNRYHERYLRVEEIRPPKAIFARVKPSADGWERIDVPPSRIAIARLVAQPSGYWPAEPPIPRKPPQKGNAPAMSKMRAAGGSR